MSDDPAARPVLRLLPGHDKRASSGYPWVYSNEVTMDAAAKALPPGGLVTLATAHGRPLGVATFNPHTLIAARLLHPEAQTRIDEQFFEARLAHALAWRQRLYEAPYYRLVHAEADGLPGLIIDRFGAVLVCQINTAGMARLEAELLAACTAMCQPRAVVLRNDSPARALEGLELEERVALGEVPGAIEIAENGVRFRIDPRGGQKTGWFYDQRDNRRFMMKLATGARVLDLYCFAGGFAVAAAVAGADQVLAIDRSQPALDLAASSADLNGVAGRCRFARADAFDELERLHGSGERFDMVIADPPAFAKSKKEVGPALRGYRKLARLSAALVKHPGFLFIASCSHNIEPDAFADAVRRGLQDAGRQGRILLSAGAAADHPVHPFLPESAYLKAQVLALD